MSNTLVVTLIVATVAFLLPACGSQGEGAILDPYTGEEDSIFMTCERSGPTELTVSELMDMDSVKDSIAIDTDDGPEAYEIRGVTFSEVMDHSGGSLDDLDGIRLVAGDGYSVHVPRKIAVEETIILAYEIDGEALHEDSRPIRIFIPGQESMYWVRNLVEIELVYPEKQVAEIEEIVFLDTRVTELEAVDYEDGDLAIRTKDLLSGISAGSVHMVAVDGFAKTEDYDIFVDAFIVVTGPDTPAFRSPDLPRGMHVRDLAWFSVGRTAFYSVTRGLELFAGVSVEGEEGIPLVELAEEMGLADAEIYILEAIDGYTVEVTREDLAVGIVHIREGGEVAAIFGGLPRNTAIRGLLSLKVAE